MHQDRCLAGCYIVGVGAGDGGVVDGLVVGGAFLECVDLDPGAGGGAEPGAGFEVLGVDPSAGAGDPEGVVVGGGQLAGLVTVLAIDVDGDLDQVFGTFAG